MKGFKSSDDLIQNYPENADSLRLLRDIILSTGLKETIKWGIPVYTYKGKNVVGMAVFKSYFALWFYQGGLLKDEDNKLINAQEGKTKALRQWRFTSVNELKENGAVIKAYIHEAVLNQDEGFEIKAQRNPAFEIPEELQLKLNNDENLDAKFRDLSLGKRREFAAYIADAKRDETKQKRLDRIMPLIIEGIGLNDKYKK